MMCKFEYLQVTLMDARIKGGISTEENYAIDRSLDLFMFSWALYQKCLRSKAHQHGIYVQ
jgi:hypothetical protein